MNKPRDGELRYFGRGNQYERCVWEQDSGLATGNYYGLILSWDASDDRWLPCCCMHGGSMYVCRSCHEALMARLHAQEGVTP